jgi:hypothetical protein
MPALVTVIRLGTVLTTGAEPEPPSPTRRKCKLLTWLGTGHHGEYLLPLLDAELDEALLEAYAADPATIRAPRSCRGMSGGLPASAPRRPHRPPAEFATGRRTGVGWATDGSL